MGFRSKAPRPPRYSDGNAGNADPVVFPTVCIEARHLLSCDPAIYDPCERNSAPQSRSTIRFHAPIASKTDVRHLGSSIRSLSFETLMVGKPKLPNWLAYVRPHVQPYLALGKGERQKYIEKLSKKTDLSDNSLRRMIAAAQFLEAEGITDLPPGGRLPLGSVENIARIAAYEPSRRRGLLDEVWAGRLTIDQLAEELEKTRRNAKRRANAKLVDPQELADQILASLAVQTLKTKRFNLGEISVHSFDDDGDLRYFDLQTKPALVIRLPKKPPIVVMDGGQTGGAAASFMRQRKEFLRNVLVAAGLYETVLVYAPHWNEDLERLKHHARPSVGGRIIIIREPQSNVPN